MRRWLAILAALLVVPVWAFATGSLTIPHTIFTQPNPVSTGLLDQNYSAIASYINTREVSFGTLAARPIAGTAGRYYFATDQNGGTLYADNGTAWVQTGAGVSGNLAQQFTGLTLTGNGTATGSFIATLGAATSDDAVVANRILMGLTANTTKSHLTAWAVGSGSTIGCLDIGAVAGSTWYHVFVIQRLDTGVTDILCSTSFAAPTMPTNYTKKRRIGSLHTDAGTSLDPWMQFGDEILWATPPVLNINSVNPGTGSGNVALLTTPPGTPMLALLQVAVHCETNNLISLYLSPPGVSDTIGTPSTNPLSTVACGVANANATVGAQARVWTNTASQIRYRLNASGAADAIYAQVLGWRDPLRTQ